MRAAPIQTNDVSQDRDACERVAQMADFLSNSPEAVGRSAVDLACLLVRHCPAATSFDIVDALRVAEIMRDARMAEHPTAAQLLVEKTRLLFGAAAASSLVMRYRDRFAIA